MVGFAFSSNARALAFRTLAAPLYARLAPDEVMNHTKRQEILAYIATNPGVHLRRIGQELGISYGTLTYHIYRLEREGYVTWAQQGLFKRFYSAAGRARERGLRAPGASTLREAERQIYELILGNPGLPQRTLATRLGLSRQSVHYHIKKMETAGFITKVPNGRETLIFATEGAVAPGLAPIGSAAEAVSVPPHAQADTAAAATGVGATNL
jgi:predicted transcriptional regulator